MLKTLVSQEIGENEIKKVKHSLSPLEIRCKLLSTSDTGHGLMLGTQLCSAEPLLESQRQPGPECSR